MSNASSHNEQNTGAAGTTRPTLTTPFILIQRAGKLPNTHEYIHGPTQLVRGEHNEEHTNTQSVKNCPSTGSPDQKAEKQMHK